MADQLKVGSLFTGYGGLTLAVEAAFNARTVWVSDVCKVFKDGSVGHYEPHQSPCTILEHRFPGVPNLGDITKVDWHAVEPVDIIDGGSPCQDISHAGKIAGMTEGTRSNLWVSMREGISIIRPRHVVWENVQGAGSAPADSSVETGPGLLGPQDGRPALRALGRVLGDLSSLGYDSRWRGVRAADVGAPHPRFRYFLLATRRA